MQRAKPRYPLPLDELFTDLALKWQVGTYELETYLVALLVQQHSGFEANEAYLEKVDRMIGRLAMRHPEVPLLEIVSAVTGKPAK